MCSRLDAKPLDPVATQRKTPENRKQPVPRTAVLKKKQKKGIPSGEIKYCSTFGTIGSVCLNLEMPLFDEHLANQPSMYQRVQQ